MWNDIIWKLLWGGGTISKFWPNVDQELALGFWEEGARKEGLDGLCKDSEI